MSAPRTAPRRTPTTRQVEGEGVLRMVLLAVAVSAPLVSLVYIKVQHTRLSYEMSQVRGRIRDEEEVRRSLVLERSKYRRDEEIQAFAEKSGMQLRKTSHLVHRPFTERDQKTAKLRPVGSDEAIR